MNAGTQALWIRMLVYQLADQTGKMNFLDSSGSGVNCAQDQYSKDFNKKNCL